MSPEPALRVSCRYCNRAFGVWDAPSPDLDRNLLAVGAHLGACGRHGPIDLDLAAPSALNYQLTPTAGGGVCAPPEAEPVRAALRSLAVGMAAAILALVLALSLYGLAGHPLGPGPAPAGVATR